MNIIGVGRVKKKISRSLGIYQKKKFEQFIYSEKALQYIFQAMEKEEQNVELISFVNSANINDLLLSIFSFLNVLGRPQRWTIYADDEFSNQQKMLLSKLNFIHICSWDISLGETEKKKYSVKWQFRKFAAFAGHLVNNTTIFLDSDVLFYPLFAKYLNQLSIHNWYLPEPPEAKNIDQDLTDYFDYETQMYIVNAGFFILNTPPNWQKGLEFIDFCSKNINTNYFHDQSALNLVYNLDPNARILDPRVFHATANDHFKISALKTNEFAIRHYVGLIRHKMWQIGWKKYFK